MTTVEDGDFGLLRTYTQNLLIGLGVGHYWSWDERPAPPCDDGDMPCIRLDTQEIERFAYQTTKRVTMRARLFVRILLWALKRLKHGVLKQAIKEYQAEHPDYVPPVPSEVHLMLCIGRDGRKTLRLGQAHGADHRHYPKELEHILGNAQGSVTHGQA